MERLWASYDWSLSTLLACVGTCCEGRSSGTRTWQVHAVWPHQHRHTGACWVSSLSRFVLDAVEDECIDIGLICFLYENQVTLPYLGGIRAGKIFSQS